ncbi:MAG: nucleoside deaminase [Erysipelothrix sp.]|jgi:tRNA(adenine34) deaminase|nr:nucleoside deaminase [Erysipelothrix sp.]
MKTTEFMQEALLEAKKAFQNNEVPVGCVIAHQGNIIARAHNSKESDQHACSHAEILAITQANIKLNSWRLEDCTLVVTLEPCMMCAGAIQQARIPYVVYGAQDKKFGAYGGCFDSTLIKGFNHYPKVLSGVLEEESITLLKSFFETRRKTKQ